MIVQKNYTPWQICLEITHYDMNKYSETFLQLAFCKDLKQIYMLILKICDTKVYKLQNKFIIRARIPSYYKIKQFRIHKLYSLQIIKLISTIII